MSRAKYYSPRIRHDLVSKLYWEAQSLNIAMTRLIDRIVGENLAEYPAKRSGEDRVCAHE